MGALLGAIARFLMSGITSLFGGWKAFIGGWLMKACLAIVLYNLVVDLVQEVLAWVQGKLGGVTAPGGVINNFDVGSVSALAAWLVNILRLPECFAFMLSMILLKWSLRKIPFVRW